MSTEAKQTQNPKDETRTTAVPPSSTVAATSITQSAPPITQPLPSRFGIQSFTPIGSQATSFTRPEIPSNLSLGSQPQPQPQPRVTVNPAITTVTTCVVTPSGSQTTSTTKTTVTTAKVVPVAKVVQASANVPSKPSTSHAVQSAPVGGARSKMETVQSNENKLLQGLLECAVCTDELKEPRLLSCLHSFCTQCLTSMFESSDQRSRLYRRLTCPLCRKVDNIPAGGIPCLPIDHRAESLRDLLKPRLLMQAHTSDCESGFPKLCGNCKTPASIFCVDCMDLYCASCDSRHRQSNYARDHVTLEVGGGSEAAESHDVTFCRRHNKVKQAYCYDCNAELCAFCAVSEQHGSHDVQSLKLVTELLYTHVNKLLPTMETVLERKRVKLSQLETLYQEREEAFTALNKLITERTAALIENLEKQRDELLEQLTVKHTGLVRRTVSNKEDLVRDIGRLETLPNNARNAATTLRASKLRQYDAELFELEDPDTIILDATLTDYFDFQFETLVPSVGQLQFVSSAFASDEAAAVVEPPPSGQETIDTLS
eukprot:GHVU01168720.1.p1 GENE.GHVU01168720.1~~GHVU01168720.1.p1  ORF type:complete len:542 (-),score=29.34 GHVU01168720.1:769-2394(-)